MSKVILKLLKYGCLIALLIFIKNIYSNYIDDSNIKEKAVTVVMPDIIELTDIKEPDELNLNQLFGNLDDRALFSEKMQYYSFEQHEKRQQFELLYQDTKEYLKKGDSSSTENYNNLLKQGIDSSYYIKNGKP